MKQALLTILRDKNTKRGEFRLASEQLGVVLAAEIAQYMPMQSVKIQTPLTETQGVILKGDVILVPILRAGLALLPPFMTIFTNSKIGFIGIRRNEANAEPQLYYQNLPELNPSDYIVVLDPMIATGGSGEMAIRLLLDAGADIDHILFAGIIATHVGITKIQRLNPKIKVVVSQIDPELNSAKFIVPGLGDFGDRFFGTELA